jgi:hypothetical protein
VRFAIDQDYTPESETLGRVSQDFPLVRALNLRILRTGIGWDDTNPHPDAYKWGYWSRVTSNAAAQGIELRPYYAYTPAWAAAAYNAPPRSAVSLARACGVMATVLGGRVGSFEIWNEPDNTSFWTGNAAGFGRDLAPCADAVHAARPQATVVLGGLVYLDSTWYERMGEAALRSIDVAAYHEYTETPWDPTTVELDNSDGYFNGGYDRMSGDGKRPVWMNEAGASTAGSQGYTEATQASWLRRTIASVLGHAGRPVSMIGLYQLRDPAPDTTPIGDPQAQVFFHHTGLFRVDGSPKLAAATVADMVGLLDGRSPNLEAVQYTPSSGRVSNGFRLYGWQLETGHQVICLWDRKASSAGSITLPSPGQAAFLHEPDGKVVPVANFDGKTLPVPTLEAGAIPLLFEVR